VGIEKDFYPKIWSINSFKLPTLYLGGFSSTSTVTQIWYVLHTVRGKKWTVDWPTVRYTVDKTWRC